MDDASIVDRRDGIMSILDLIFPYRYHIRSLVKEKEELVTKVKVLQEILIDKEYELQVIREMLRRT